ncbi:MAG: DNA breaking-rejoining protein [Pseudomonadota bacterium]
MGARHLLVVASLLVAGPGLAQDEIRKERIQFAAGETSAAVSGSIKGYNIVDYMLGAAKGQTMQVSLQTDNASSYFNVLPPGSETALFVGSVSGNHWTGMLPQAGDYTVRVYLMRNAARRNETATYDIAFAITNGPSESGR